MKHIAGPGWLTTTAVALILAMATVLALPYLLKDLKLPKSEDYEYTILPTVLYAQQILHDGVAPSWNPNVGLGAPWPPPSSLTHSPFTPLFAILPPLTVVGLLVFFHTALLGAASLLLAHRYGLRGIVQLAVVLTIVCSTAIEYLYWSDAITVYTTWALFPLILLLTDMVLRDNISRATVAAIFLGFSAGYVALNGHLGVMSAYLLAPICFGLTQLKTTLKRSPLLLLSVLIAGLIGAEKLFFLLAETQLFPVVTPRDQQGLHGGASGMFWNSFIRPLFWPGPKDLLDVEHLLSKFASSNNFSRTAGFGALFTGLAVVTIFQRHSWRDPLLRPLLVTFVVSLALIFWPLSLLPKAVSATWPLRDAVLVSGVLLSGRTFQDWWARRHRTGGNRVVYSLLVLQVAQMGGSATALIGGPNWLISRGIATSGEYDRMIDRAHLTPYARLLVKTLSADGAPGGRVIASGEASIMMDREMLVDLGAVNNISLAHGASEVSFIAKGLSFDSIRPAQSMPYGLIAGDRMVRWQLNMDQNSDWTRDDQALLTFLGIEAVVASSAELVTADSLAPTGRLNGIDGFSIIVYRNTETLPRAFSVDEELLDALPSKRSGCNANALYCIDVKSVVSAAKVAGITIALSGDRFDLKIFPSNASRSILVTQMYRPDWGLSPESKAAGVTLSEWQGLIRLQVPEGVTQVQANYRPVNLLIARQITNFSMLAAVLFTIGIFLLEIRRFATRTC